MKNLVLPLLFLVSVFESGFSINKCPPEILIKPCVCYNFLGIPVLICNNILEMKVLEDVFERSADRAFQTFNLFNSSIMYLPAKGISDKKVQVITLFKVTMSAMFDVPPSPDNRIGMITLKSVTFQRGIGWELFAPMKKLSIFKAYDTEIRSLEKSFVDNISDGLTKIVIFNAKTRKIQYNAFAKLTKLKYFEITNGELKSLKRSMFAKPSALTMIDLSANQIEDLPEDIFSDMPALTDVDFSGNKITMLSQAIFADVVNRKGNVHLEGNPLKCECSMLWYVSGGQKTLTGSCAFPLDQKGKLVQKMTKKDLDYCQWQISKHTA